MSEPEKVPADQRQRFAEIAERNRDRAYAVAYSTLGDRALSEEITQEALLTAWRKLPELQNTSKLPAWICGIARNLARNARRKHAREAPLALGGPVPVAPSTPFDEVAKAQSHAVVQRALDEIDERYRDALVLYYLTGKSLKDIALALDTSEAAAKQLLSRGRKKIAAKVLPALEEVLDKSGPRAGFGAAVLAAFDESGIAHAQLPIAASVATPTVTSSLFGLPAKLIAAAALVTAAAVIGMAAISNDGEEPLPGEAVTVPTADAVTVPSSDSAAPKATAGELQERPEHSTPAARSAIGQEESFDWESVSGTAGVGVRASALENRQRLLMPIDMDFGEAAFENVMRLLSDVTETNIFVVGNDFGTINMRLKKTPAIDVLDEALLLAGAKRIEIPVLKLNHAPSCDAEGFPGDPVTASFDNAEPSDVLAVLSQRTSVPLLVAREADGQKVSLRFEATPFDEALMTFVSAAGFGCETDFAFEVSADDDDGAATSRSKPGNASR